MQAITASGEQNDGVNQITRAMNPLNNTPQPTAAASEQLSATAEELPAQASRLQALMGCFRIDAEAGARHRAATPKRPSRSAATVTALRFDQNPRQAGADQPGFGPF